MRTAGGGGGANAVVKLLLNCQATSAVPPEPKSHDDNNGDDSDSRVVVVVVVVVAPTGCWTQHWLICKGHKSSSDLIGQESLLQLTGLSETCVFTLYCVIINSALYWGKCSLIFLFLDFFFHNIKYKLYPISTFWDQCFSNCSQNSFVDQKPWDPRLKRGMKSATCDSPPPPCVCVCVGGGGGSKGVHKGAVVVEEWSHFRSRPLHLVSSHRRWMGLCPPAVHWGRVCVCVCVCVWHL